MIKNVNKLQHIDYDKLKILIDNNDYLNFKKYLYSSNLFNINFSNNDFNCDTRKYKQIAKYVYLTEKKNYKRKFTDSLVYKTSLNIIDINNKIRDYYNWKCEICGINCFNNKNILDIHSKTGVIGMNNNVTKKDIIICCRLCYFNIKPSEHWNSDMSKTIINKIHYLRNLHP